MGNVREEETDRIILTAVEDVLETIPSTTTHPATNTQSTETESGNKGDKIILINVMLPVTEAREEQSNLLEQSLNSIQSKIESKIGITSEVLLNANNLEVVKRIQEGKGFYYIVLTVDRSNEISRGKSIN